MTIAVDMGRKATKINKQIYHTIGKWLHDRHSSALHYRFSIIMSSIIWVQLLEMLDGQEIPDQTVWQNAILDQLTINGFS